MLLQPIPSSATSLANVANIEARAGTIADQARGSVAMVLAGSIAASLTSLLVLCIGLGLYLDPSRNASCFFQAAVASCFYGVLGVLGGRSVPDEWRRHRKLRRELAQAKSAIRAIKSRQKELSLAIATWNAELASVTSDVKMLGAGTAMDEINIHKRRRASLIETRQSIDSGLERFHADASKFIEAFLSDQSLA